EVSFVDRWLALENRVNGLGRDVSMFIVVQQGRRVLPVKDNDVDRVADVPFRVEDNCFFDRIAVGEVFAKKINEVLLIYFAAIARMSDAIRCLQFRNEALLLSRE